MSNDVRAEVIRDLVTQYKTSTPEQQKILFTSILARVDRLLMSVCIKVKHIYHQLDDTDYQDLYQTAVVSLYRAIDSVKDTDSGERIQARIQSYVKEEIRKGYLSKKRQINPMDLDLIKELVLANEPEFDQVEMADLYENIWALVDLGDVSRNDLNLLIEHTINGLTYTDIAKRHGVHYTTVSNRIKKLKEILRQRLE